MIGSSPMNTYSVGSLLRAKFEFTYPFVGRIALIVERNNEVITILNNGGRIDKHGTAYLDLVWEMI